jgi:hypothetical protein
MLLRGLLNALLIEAAAGVFVAGCCALANAF